MKIRAVQLLKVEDFPEQKGWISKLISPLNDFVSQAIKILNGGITFGDNMDGKDYTYSFTYQSESITFPQIVAWTLLSKPVALSVVAATQDGLPFIPAVAWEFTTDGKISLSSVVRLTNAPAVSLLQVGSQYKIRVRVTP